MSLLASDCFRGATTQTTTSGAIAKAMAPRRSSPIKIKLLTTIAISSWSVRRAASGSGKGLDPGIVVEGDDGDLAIGAAEPQDRLVAVETLAPHFDAADGAQALILDDPLDLGGPLAVADAEVLGHAEPGPGSK